MRKRKGCNTSHGVFNSESDDAFCFPSEALVISALRRAHYCGDWPGPGWPIGGGLPKPACWAGSFVYIGYWTTLMGDMLFTSCQVLKPIAAGWPGYETDTACRSAAGGLWGLIGVPGKDWAGLVILLLRSVGDGCTN